jgi:hypothetical protein
LQFRFAVAVDPNRQTTLRIAQSALQMGSMVAGFQGALLSPAVDGEPEPLTAPFMPTEIDRFVVLMRHAGALHSALRAFRVQRAPLLRFPRIKDRTRPALSGAGPGAGGCIDVKDAAPMTHGSSRREWTLLDVKRSRYARRRAAGCRTQAR